MKAIILGGGLGTRTRPISDLLPKPLLPIVERPLLDHILDILHRCGVDDIIITIGYKGEMIENRYMTGQSRGMHISYSLEGHIEKGKVVFEGLGSAGGIKKVQEFGHFFNEPFFVLCADALIDLNLKEAMEFHKSHNGIATVITKEIDINEVYKYGVVLSDENGKVSSFQEKPSVKEAKSNIINTGIYIFEPEIFDYIPKNTKYDIGGELLPSLLDIGKEFYAINMDFKWIDVGTIRDFYEANMMLLKKETCYIKPYYKRVIDKNIFVGINCSINFDKVDIQGPVYIGNSVKIEDGCKIVGPCVINSNSEIYKDSLIKNSIILNHTILNENSKIIDSIVSQDFCIEVE